MTIPYRGQTGFSTYFITFNIWQKRRLLQSDRSALLFIEILYKFRSESRYLVHEFVVMPNHVHALLTPLRPNTLERCVGLIKGAFSFQYSRISRYPGETWQPSFVDRRVRDSQEYQRFQTYIQQNPVKAGLVATPEEFPHGSASGNYELDEIPQGLKPISKAAAKAQA